jgi:PAS domain S-box-containing protein
MSEAGAIRVLHVDDEPDFADMVATFLEREDDRITVQTVNSPIAGLELASEHDIDCIVSDYDMPAQNGIEFLDAVRERYPDLPFILYTGKGSEEIASEAISAGVTDYLQKESGTGQYPVLANRISNAVEQYRSRQAVRETEQKLSELAERTDDVLFIVNGDWSELLFVNSAYEDIWGASIEELEKDPSSFLDSVHPDDHEEVRASVQQLSNGEPSQVEYRIIRRDGEQRWVRGDTQPILDEAGDVVRIVGQVRDITERKERELHLETIIDNLPGYVYRHKHDSEYPPRFVKGDAEMVTGYTATELEEDVTLAEEIIHPDDREDLWAEHIEGLEATGRFDSTYRIITKDGDVRWIRDQGQLIEDPTTGQEVIDGFVTDVSDHVQRERELKRQQAFIDESLDALQDVFYAINEDRELIRWNDRVSEVSGYTDEEIEEIDMTEFFAEEHRDRIKDGINETMETGSSLIRADVLTASGERIPFEFRKTRLTDSNRGEAVAVGVGRDVSDQVKRERELERIHDFFTRAERLGDLGAWEFDVDGDLVWTDGTRRIHEVEEGFTPTIEKALDFFHPDDRETIEQAIEDALEKGHSYDLELRIDTAKGNQRWVRTRGEVLADEESPTVKGLIQDITEHKEREDELNRRQSLFESILETSIDGILVVDENREYVTWNQQFIDMWGLPEELVGDNPEELGLEYIRDKLENPQEFIDEVEYLYEHPHEESRDEIRLADGRVFDRYSALVETDDGTHVGRVWFFRDITDRKERERELARQNDRLEKFANVVSHDLKNPLNVAQGRLELASEQYESEDLDSAARAVDRSLTLIEDLLTLARQGQAVGDVESVQLAEICESCWQTVETGDSTLSIETDRTIRADPGRLKQLLENLMRNAIEHGGKRVSITVGDLDDGFYVADDGAGIPEDEREDVFEAGYSTTDEGTGFGLNIVNEIVEAHGWEITVCDSTEGGARFEITGVESPAG